MKSFFYLLSICLSLTILLTSAGCIQTKSLVASAETGDLKAAKNALKKGADVNAKDEFYGNTALQEASFGGYENIVRLLIENGADVNIKGKGGLAALHHAVIGSRENIVQLLLKNGADVNIQSGIGSTALYFAAELGNENILKSLLVDGADVNIKSDDGKTALHIAAQVGNLNILRILLKNGAEVNAKDNLRQTALHKAAIGGFSEIAISLIGAGSEINSEDNNADTPISLAKKNRNIKVQHILNSELMAQKITLKQNSSIAKKEVSTTTTTAFKPAVKKKSALTSLVTGPYYAIVIGNNEYQHLPKLNTAINDAYSVENILSEKYGFKVKLLLNATRSDILLAINSYRKTLTNIDNFLIYYAGHGWLDKDADQGYWLPVDATRDNKIMWISNSSITSEIRAIRAKHVMVVADSCYSGMIARGLHVTHRTPDYLTRMSKKKARVVLSSGGLEPVLDSGGENNHSVFASAFISTLNENNKVLDGASLFTKVREKVGWNADQIPEYAVIHKAGHEGGDFLFIRKRY
jgi:ankyrin repeat protein